MELTPPDPFLTPLLELGVVAVSRLLKDACLYDLPPETITRGRGRPRIYGKNKLSLAKRAGHRQGWESITFNGRGVQTTRQYKTFLATSRLTGGVIRVVIVRFEDGGWNLNGSMYTLVELCCWDAEKADLTDRSDRPWDNPDRRPSHADRRRKISRGMLQKQILAALPNTPENHKLHSLFNDLIALAA